MEDVRRCLEQDDWPLALVSLAAAATPQALAHWEQALGPSASLRAQRISEWFVALQQRVPSLEELASEPLAILSALDQLVAATRVPRFTDSPLRARGQDWWLVPVTARWPSAARLKRQVGRLDRHLHHHAIVPATVGTATAPLRVRCVAVAGELAREMEDLRQRPDAQLTAWIAHFDDRCVVQWRRQSPSGRVVARGIEPAGLRAASLRTSLQQAAQQSAWLWLAPELSLSPEQQREAVDAALAAAGQHALRLLVPGSWHQEMEGGYANLATLYDGLSGDALLSHRKLRVFGSYGTEGALDEAEGVIPGDAVTLFVTPIGNWTLLICKDFLDADAAVATLVQQLCADWVLVPSYGGNETMKAQVRRAEQVCRIERACHALVATLRDCKGDSKAAHEPHLPGFAHLAGEPRCQQVPEAGGLVRIALRLEHERSPVTLVK